MPIQLVIEEHFDVAIAKIDNTIKDRMLQAVFAVQKEAIETLSTPGTGKRYLVPGSSQKWYTASSPGQPPAVYTGMLRKNVKVAVEGDARQTVGMVGTDQKEGLWMEFGTRGGKTITAKKGGVLAFGVNGKMVFAKEVTQGPIAPRPWLRISFERSMGKVKEIFTRNWF